MALLELTITNLAIVDRVRLEPAPGFNVLTGETGAGKSIIVDALMLLAGGRAGPGIVRAGADRAVVEGIFDASALAAGGGAEALAELGAEPDDGTVILAREVAATGRSVARVNGRAVPVRALAGIAGRLLDIHGQSEHLSLLQPREQAALLDRYAGLTGERAAFAAAAAELRHLRRELASLRSDDRELARRIDLLTYQAGEIAAAGLHPGEDEELRRERSRHANAERLAALAAEAHAGLVREGDGGAADRAAAVARTLAAVADLDPDAEGLRRAADSAAFALEDLAREVRAYRDGVEHDPVRLAGIEERLAVIRDLERKYGSTVEDVIAFGQRAEEELAGCRSAGDRARALEAREAELLEELGRRAAALSSARRTAAARLVPSAEAELAELGMAGTRLTVRFRCTPSPDGLPNPSGLPAEATVRSDDPPVPAAPGARLAFDDGGVDGIELWISPNPGEPPAPLRAIVSGGEMSRTMLAIRTVLAGADPVPVLVFDEIDSGVGGRVGAVVGRKLAALGRSHQVLAVTHLPQIAAYGDRHVRVAKRVEAGRTGTVATTLDEDGRLEEIAAMLGAPEGSARQAAADLLAARTLQPAGD